eukprot:1807373-Pyramimonas_sp.AAC.1
MECVSESLLQDLFVKLRESPFLSFIVDESNCVSNKKKLLIYVKYLVGGCEPRTEFLGIVELEKADANTIFEAIKRWMDHHNINKQKFAAMGSDGASVMMGKNSGVATLWVDFVQPFAVVMHCHAHRLNLGVGDATKNVPYVKEFEDIITQTYGVVARSANNKHDLQVFQRAVGEKRLEAKRLHKVRWLGFVRCVEQIYSCLESWICLFSKIAAGQGAEAAPEEEDVPAQPEGLPSKTPTKKVASSLLKTYLSYQFLMMTAYFRDVSGAVAQLC